MEPEILMTHTVSFDVGLTSFDRLPFNNIPFDLVEGRFKYIADDLGMKYERNKSPDVEKPLEIDGLIEDETESIDNHDFITFTKECKENNKIITIRKVVVDEETYRHMNPDMKIPKEYLPQFFGYICHNPVLRITFEHYLNETAWSWDEIMKFINGLEIIGICHPYQFITAAFKRSKVMIMLEKPKICSIMGNKNEVYIRYNKEKHVLDSYE